jgi:hypothetical protein
MARRTACRKFLARFGRAAPNFVNSAVGKELHLRGINANEPLLGSDEAA